jgi:hypothetical protein
MSELAVHVRHQLMPDLTFPSFELPLQGRDGTGHRQSLRPPLLSPENTARLSNLVNNRTSTNYVYLLEYSNFVLQF